MNTKLRKKVNNGFEKKCFQVDNQCSFRRNYGGCYVISKYRDKAKLCYMDTEDIYVDITKHVETRFDTSNYELERPLPKRKSKKVIGLMKNELGWKIMHQYQQRWCESKAT